MAVQLVWRHPDRREVEIALYVSMRMMHLRGWRRVVVCCDRRDVCFLGVELADTTPEDDAQAWASLLHRRYRLELSLEQLVADPWRYAEIYIDGGVGAFLNAYEQEQHRAELLRQAARNKRGPKR